MKIEVLLFCMVLAFLGPMSPRANAAFQLDSGLGLYFDGTDSSFVEIQNTNNVNLGGSSPTDAFTISWWQFTEGNQERYPRIFQAGAGGDFADKFAISEESDNKLYFWKNGVNMLDMSGIPLPLNNHWNHFALVKSGCAYSFYINGSSVFSVDYTLNLIGGGDPLLGGGDTPACSDTPYDTSNLNFYFGGTNLVGPGSFKGTIFGFQIANYARWTSLFTPPTNFQDLSLDSSIISPLVFSLYVDSNKIVKDLSGNLLVVSANSNLIYQNVPIVSPESSSPPTPLAPSFTLTTSSETLTVGSSISGYSINSTGGAIDSFSIAPALDDGILFDTATGLLSGTPTKASGPTTFTISGINVTDTATATFTLKVIPIPPDPPAFTLSVDSESATVGSTISGYSINSTGGSITNYSISPPIGNGLSFNTSTGLISGSPLTAASSIRYTITAHNSTADATANFSLEVKANPAAPIVTRALFSQNISFPKPANMQLKDLGQIISAAASSGLPVTLSVTTPEFCQINAGKIYPIKYGVCTIIASQDGDSNYYSAPSISQSFTIHGLTQNISFEQPTDMTTVSDDQKLFASASSKLPTIFKSNSPDICSISLNYVIPIAAGTCSISAIQLGDLNYEPSNTLREFTINYHPKSDQHLLLSTLVAMKLTDSPQTIEFSSNTKVPVTAIVTSKSVCTINEAMKVVPKSIGTCSVRIIQDGTRFYNTASATQNFEVVSASRAAQKRAVGFSWKSPASIYAGTALSTDQLNAISKVPGKFVYSPQIGTVLPSGYQSISVTFYPSDSSKYVPVKNLVHILVLRNK